MDNAAHDVIGWRPAALATAVGVSIAGGFYLTQVLRVSEWQTPWLTVAFVFAEVYSVLTLTSLCWTVTRFRRRAHRVPVHRPVDVFIPTLNEPVEVLEPTVRGALALAWSAPVRVFVLDDGNREEVAALAERLGARYHARAEHSLAKAGNLNAGLALTADDAAPIVAVFDADHVAVPEFLERTVGHLDDPEVVLVQTPQYYRLDGSRAVRIAAEQQLLLCDRIGPSRDAFDTMFCMGTNYVVERAALDQIGGYPRAITEDVMVSLEFLHRGLRVAYVHEPLAIGLAPPTLPAFVSQQTRWALGSLEFMTRRRDLLKGVSALAAWQYATLPLHWFYGITFPIYLGIALCGVAFGWQPYESTSTLLLGAQLAWAGAALAAIYLTVRGVLSLDGFLVKWGSFVVTFRALRQLFRPLITNREVAQKVRGARERSGSASYLRMSAAIVGVMIAALVVRGYQASIVLPLLVSGTNALALFILALHFRADDRRSVAAPQPSNTP